ncbi:hypothetical protein HNQ07_004774 [Deinococcus metalli]|uniref:Uncharacterized protein n=1 Tax=Deinococcus metalli TaxID=1141878 RepID=A0A7W8KMB9_9DEIO|nr:hypothetical protein [Deinococcus metalli]MBB5379259.1 hypothetical protein [Deinococcus metalli]GHF66032.1 hypothetical protein GCM10017781_47210 [Deinococcus metalli]
MRYNVPTRQYSYDTSFNTFAGLPPLTPRVVSLRQQLFARDW